MRRMIITLFVLSILACKTKQTEPDDAPTPSGRGVHAGQARPDPAPSERGGLAGQVERIVTEKLTSSSVPSVSVAVVRERKVVIAEAMGYARLEPRTEARASMRYPIGSISKQFTAAAILLLVDEGKLSLDDTIQQFFPEVTEADRITVRDLLAHTAGIQDYYPQWYISPPLEQPEEPREIVERWGQEPLGFEPGTRWQYSNTGYTAAGLIVEQLSGKPLFEFMSERIFEPLDMTVLDYDVSALSEQDPAGYVRNALAPPRPAGSEASGWKFGAGQLAMSAEDLARWNVAIMERRLLSEAAYRELTTAVQLPDGVSTTYGLGLVVELEGDRRKLAHGGAVEGFAGYNVVFPDDGAAVTVLVNEPGEGYGVARDIATQIARLVLESDGKVETRARDVFESLQGGKIDQALFTGNARAYFSEDVLSDYAASLGPLGKVKKVTQTRRTMRGGFIYRRLSIECEEGKVGVAQLDRPDGVMEQFHVYPLE